MPKINIVKNLITLISLGAIWGTGYSIARFAMTNDVPPLGYSFWQSLGPAIVMSIIIFIRHKHTFWKTGNIRFYLISGLTGIAIPNTSMYFAAQHLHAGVLAMIVNTVPIFAYPMALFLHLEKFNIQRIVGILFALSGLFIIIAPGSTMPSPEVTHWSLITLIAPLSFAVCSIYIARYRPAGSDSLLLATGMLSTSAIFLLPLVLYNNSFYMLHFPLTLPDKIILLEIILSSIGYVLFFYLIKTAGPVYYSLVDTIVVLTGISWGYIIFNEKLTQWTGLAVIFIIIALLLVTSNQRIAVTMDQQYGKDT